jgi:hypothetical protein
LSRLTRNPILAVAGAIVFLGISLFVAAQVKGPSPEQVQRSTVQREAHLRDALQWACEYEANPLRRVIQSMIREDIRSSARVKPSYFPSIPRKVLRRLIRVQVEAKRRQLRRAAPVNCAGIYHSPN